MCCVSYKLFSFAFANRKCRCWSLENDLRVQIDRVIGVGVPTGAVIVIGSTIKARVARVLRTQQQVLPGPIGKVRNVAAASRIAVEIAAYCARWKQSKIGGAGRVEPAECPCVLIADVVFGVRQNRVQVMLTLVCSAPGKTRQQVGILSNVAGAE